jgi:hypothetical protein
MKDYEDNKLNAFINYLTKIEKQMKRMVFELNCSIKGVTINDLERDSIVKVDVVEGTVMYFKAYIKDMYAPVKINITG